MKVQPVKPTQKPKLNLLTPLTGRVRREKPDFRTGFFFRPSNALRREAGIYLKTWVLKGFKGLFARKSPLFRVNFIIENRGASSVT